MNMGYDFYSFLALTKEETRSLHMKDVMKMLDIAVHNLLISKNFNGISVVQTWQDTATGYKIVYSLGNDVDNYLVAAAVLDDYGMWQPTLGLASPDYTGTVHPYTNGLTTVSNGKSWSPYDVTWEDYYPSGSETIGVELHCIVDNSTNTLISLSTSSTGSDIFTLYEIVGDGYDHSLFFDREKGKVFSPLDALFFNADGTWKYQYDKYIANLNGNMSPVGGFITPSRSTYESEKMIEQTVMYKDVFFNPQKYDLSIPLKSYMNSNWDGYFTAYNQQIQTEDGKKYIHVGNNNLFIPYDNYIVDYCRA